MPEVGDRVSVQSRKLGQAVREGVVTGVVGHLLRVEWSTGEESTFMPGPGAVTVVGKVRKSTSKKVAAPVRAAKATESVPKAKKATKKATGRKGSR